MHTIHIISHTHWDREWYLTYQQFRMKLVHLIDHLLDLLENEPDYRFFMLDGQTIVLEDYLEVRPEKEAALRAYIQSGRILIGPWYILPDEFLVSPEAHIRNLLIGDQICSRFGPKLPIGYLPDTFGHIGQMPQIVKGFGFESASLWRGVEDLPAEFWWRAPDGSQVFMAFLRDSYGNGANLPVDDPERFQHTILKLKEALAPHSATGHLLVMHGMDHMEPVAGTGAAIQMYNAKNSGDLVRLEHSTLPNYLKAVQAKIQSRGLQIPTVTGELRACRRAPLLPGVLSTRMWIKQRNQACETLLEKWAEPFSAWASLLLEKSIAPTNANSLKIDRLQQPNALLRQAWHQLVQCHPHDSICGCSIDQVHAEMRPRFDQVEQIGNEVTLQSLQAIASLSQTQPTNPDGFVSTITVFNPTTGPRTDWVEVEMELPEGVGNLEIYDEAGQKQQFQSLGNARQVLINIAMGIDEFKSSAGMVSAGRVMKWVISDFKVEQKGSEGHLELIFAETGEPNLQAIERAAQKIQGMLGNPEITRFVIRALSAASARSTLLASQVPGFGYRTFWVKNRPMEELPPTALKMNPFMRALAPLAQRVAQLPWLQKILNKPSAEKSSPPPYSIENEFFILEASAEDGTLTLLDKRSGLAFHGLNCFVDGGDCGDEYNYSPPENDRLVSKIKLLHAHLEKGRVGQSMQFKLIMHVPQSLANERKSRSETLVDLEILTRISLSPGVARIDIHTEVDNTAQDHRLRVHFPTPFRTALADYDGHFEVVQRPVSGSVDGNLPYPDENWVEQPRGEAPQRAFTAIQDDRGGLVVANRGLPEAAVLTPSQEGREIAITLLRCVGWLSRNDFSTRKGDAGPAYATPGAQLPGKHAFDYALIPYLPGKQVGAYHQAYAFNAPLRAVAGGLHSGELPGTASLVESAPLEFVLSAIKMVEHGDGWIVRGYNISREPIEVTLKPWKRHAQASRVNLAEKEDSRLDIAEDGSVSFTAGACQVVTVKFA